MFRSPLAPAGCLALLAPMPATAQTVVEIDDDIACDACVIETGPPVTLAAPDELWFSSLSAVRVARDREGHFIAAPAEGDALVAVFGPDGAYRSSYGRIGEGPGEFATDMPLLVEVGEGDVVFVMDPVNLHTLAPRADSSLRQARMPVSVLGGSTIVRGGIVVEAAAQAGLGVTTVRIVRPDGTIAATIGASGTDAGASEYSRYALGRSNDHMDVWIAPAYRFVITRYGPGGEARTRVERNSTWFRRSQLFTPGAPLLPPARPAVTDIHQDADGPLWLAVSRPVRSFSSLAPRGGASAEVLIGPTVNLNDFLRTSVEVIDPAAGEVIARRDFDELIRFVRTPGDDLWVQSLRADVSGAFECIVTPLVLRRG